MQNVENRETSQISHAVDWVGLTLFPEEFHGGTKANISGMLAAVCSALEIPNCWHPVGKSNRGYAEVRINEAVEGVTVYCTPYAAGQLHLHLEIKGKGCEAIGSERIGRLDTFLSEVGIRWQVTRCDFAFDHCAFTPDDLYRCWISGKTQTRIRSYDYKRNNEGTTFYCGNKQSFQLCCYDKRGFTRAEIRVYGKDARVLGKAIITGGYSHAAYAALLIFSNSVTFNEADGSSLPGWLSLRALADAGQASFTRAPRISPRLPAHVKVAALHERFRSYLAAVAILAAGFRYPSSLVSEMLAEMKIDSASQPEVDKIRKLVDGLD